MSKPDLSTQAARWKYVVAGGTLKSGGLRVTFHDGQLRFYNRDGELNPERLPVPVALLCYNEWEAYTCPIKVDTVWDFFFDHKAGLTYPVVFAPEVFDIRHLIGKRFKVSLEEITE